MKIMVDDVEVLAITDLDKSVLADDIPSSVLDTDIKRRVRWVITHKIAQNAMRLRKQWTPILKKEGIDVPENDAEFVTLVFAREDYKDAQAKYEEANKDL